MRNQVKGERLAAARPLLPLPQAGEEGGGKDPERISTGSAGRGTFNPVARGSSPPGFTTDH
jgi:hypothetical protein